MPSISDTAICLRRWDFSETSQTVSLFSREHGVLRALAKGAKRPRGAFSGGLDVLTRGQMVAIVKSGRDLSTLTEWHLQETFRAVRRGLAANRAAFYMADLVSHMLTDHDPHPALFDALCAGLRALEDEGAVGAALLRVQWVLLVETGYRPDLGPPAAAEGGVCVFDPRAGGVVGPGEAHGGWKVRAETIGLLRAVEAAEQRGTDADVVDRANRLLASYCREIIGREIPTLSWAFSDLSRG